MAMLQKEVMLSSVINQGKIVAIQAGGKSVAELTDFCKRLSEKEARQNQHSSNSDTESETDGDLERPYHHPFELKQQPLPSYYSSSKGLMSLKQKQLPEPPKLLSIEFPSIPRNAENEWVPVSPKAADVAGPNIPDEKSHSGQTAKGEVSPSQKCPSEDQNEANTIISSDSIITGGAAVSSDTPQLGNSFEGGQLGEAERAQRDMRPASWRLTWRTTAASSHQITRPVTASENVQSSKLKISLRSELKETVRKDTLQSSSHAADTVLNSDHTQIQEKHLDHNIDGVEKDIVALNELCVKCQWKPPEFESCPTTSNEHIFKVCVNGQEFKSAVASKNENAAKADAARVCLASISQTLTDNAVLHY